MSQNVKAPVEEHERVYRAVRLIVRREADVNQRNECDNKQ